jgi:hypothetical protein
MSELLELNRLPRHVLMPTSYQIGIAQAMGVLPQIGATSWTPADCDTCKGKGQFRAWGGAPGDVDNIVEYRCPCREQLRLRRWFAAHGLPPSYQHYTLSMALGWPPQDPRYQYLSESLIEIEDQHRMPTNTILFSPQPATGKTLLSVLLHKALLKQGFDAHFIRSASLGQGAIWGGETGREVQAWWTKRIRSADLVIIDDLGRESQGNQFARARVEDLIRHRTDLGLPWVISTNYDPRVLKDDRGGESQFVIRYGEEVARTMTNSARFIDFVRVDPFDPNPIEDLRIRNDVARPACFMAVNA